MYKRILSIILVLVLTMALFVGATSSLATQENITLRIHYHRPDGDYEGWNVWAWDRQANYSIYGISDLDGSYGDVPSFKLEANGEEVVCTLTVPAGVNEMGYILRYNNWDEKDIEYDQFIDLSGIVSGTIDFYVESGVHSQESYSPTPSRDSLCNVVIVYNGRSQNMMVLGSDVVTDCVVTHAEYENKQNGHRLIVTLSSTPDYTLTADHFKLVDKNGEIVNITAVKNSGSTCYLSLDSRLYFSNSYTLFFNNRQRKVLVGEAYASRITGAKYDYTSDTPTLSLTFSLAPDYNDLSPSSFYITSNRDHVVQVSQIEGSGTQCLLYLDQPLNEASLYWIYLHPYAFYLCDHADHNINGFCLRCGVTVAHSYDENNTCTCDKVLITEPTPDPDPITPMEPTIPDEPDTPVEPTIPDEPDTPVEPTIPDEPDTPAEPSIPDQSVTPVDPIISDGFSPSVDSDGPGSLGAGNNTDSYAEGSLVPEVESIYKQQSATNSPQPTDPQPTPVDNTPKDDPQDNTPSIDIPLILILVLVVGGAVATVIILIKRKKT